MADRDRFEEPDNDRFEQEQAEAAAAEAAAIGGRPGEAGGEPVDEARRPLEEAGEGESEGFEAAERELIEHASHGDMRPAHDILHDAGADEESAPAMADDEAAADHEHTSERLENDR